MTPRKIHFRFQLKTINDACKKPYCTRIIFFLFSGSINQHYLNANVVIAHTDGTNVEKIMRTHKWWSSYEDALMLKQLWGSPNDETVMRTHKWINSDGGHTNEETVMRTHLWWNSFEDALKWWNSCEDALMIKQLRGRIDVETVMKKPQWWDNYEDAQMIKQLWRNTNDETVMRMH